MSTTCCFVFATLAIVALGLVDATISTPGAILGTLKQNVFQLDVGGSVVFNNSYGSFLSLSAEGANASVLANTNVALLVFQPCTYLLPHAHPRGTEIEYTYQGQITSILAQDQAATIDPVNGLQGVTFSSTPSPAGTVSIYPQGLYHTQINYGCEVAKVYVSFVGAEPGFQFFPPTQFLIDDPVTQALNYTEASVRYYKALTMGANAPGLPLFMPLNSTVCNCAAKEELELHLEQPVATSQVSRSLLRSRKL